MKPEGITDRPVPPWELPGAFRRDGEPHRADWLYRLAQAARWATALAMVQAGPTFFPAVGGSVRGPGAEVLAAGALLFALPGFLLAITAVAQARSDLGLMYRGLMDPSGRGRTADAAHIGREAVVFSFLISAGAAVVLLLALRRG
jgi:hypothetical protein